ncbi:MAG: response regulator [Nitrosopumilus sp.]
MVLMQTMIINDSRAMRQFLEDIVNSYDDCEIMGSYFDATVALDDLKIKRPDVILLDLEMPKMDGITFLDKLKNKKYPTIVVSNYASDGSEIVNDALALGAVDSLKPPPSNSKKDFEDFKNLLHHKLAKASLKSQRYTLGN